MRSGIELSQFLRIFLPTFTIPNDFLPEMIGSQTERGLLWFYPVCDKTGTPTKA